jgi:hypothetical protein
MQGGGGNVTATSGEQAVEGVSSSINNNNILSLE